MGLLRRCELNELGVIGLRATDKTIVTDRLGSHDHNARDKSACSQDNSGLKPCPTRGCIETRAWYGVRRARFH